MIRAQKPGKQSFLPPPKTLTFARPEKRANLT
jgi:hypothetical protein